MHVVEHGTPASYADAARESLLGREDLCGLPLGILIALERDPSLYPRRSLFTIHSRVPAPLASPSDSIVGAAHWTPPHPLCLSPMPNEAIAALATHVARALGVSGEHLTALVGDPSDVSAFEAYWGGIRGAPPLRQVQVMEQGIYRLDAVTFPTPPVGTMRLATETDRPLLEDWEHAFCVDCQIGMNEAAAKASVARALSSGTRYVLEVGGEVVSMAGVSGRTPNGARVGYVYTPPRMRGRGHASEIVASLSAHLLASGLRFLTLYTDLANPTSNAIYRRIGYARIGASRFVRYCPPPPP